MGGRGYAQLPVLLRLVEIAQQTHDNSEQLVRLTVIEARDAGATWREIGAALRMNEEAARKRYGR